MAYLFLTDGVTIPLPLHPSPTLAKTISHANKPTWLPVAQRLARGMNAVQHSFWGEALPNIRWASPYPPHRNTYGGGRNLPYPNLCPPADPLPWGSSGAIAIPNPREAVEPLPITNLREAEEPMPIPNNRHQRHLSWGRP